MDLSVIIVNYNTEKLTRQAIKSVLDTVKYIDYEIIVVDNASKDDSVNKIKREFPGVKLIINNENLGFSTANNQGIRVAKGRHILLLNSDTVVRENCIERCIKYSDNNPEVGVVGCRVIKSDGTLDKACKRSFPTPINSLYHALTLDKLFPNNKRFGAYNLTYLSEYEVNEIECVVGAFMLVKIDVIEKVGTLDERFFMYGEDIDWCYRIKMAGFKIIYYPYGEIIHYKGASNKKKRFKIIFEFYNSMYIFYNKHYKNKYNFLVTLLVYLGIALKMIASLLMNLFKKRW